jgi:two-component system, NarL family, sensor histidine kinase DegS
VPALRRYIQDFKQFTGLNCVVEVEGAVVRLSSQVEVSIYRLLQEALQNVSQHAQAQNIEVTIEFQWDALQLSICDDGVGFDLAAVNDSGRAHFGLITMRERAKKLNGYLSINSQPLQGTCVTLYVPTIDHNQAEIG